jgi:hypothetical protein
MLHSRRDHKGQRGQMLVLFELVLIIILMCAALVIDIGLLRNDRQALVNAVDAAALAGGAMMPVSGPTNAAKANALIDLTIKASYPGLPTGSYKISYKCLIGADASGPLISRDIPGVCDPRPSHGGTVSAGDFTGAGKTRVSSCDPMVGDTCNTVLVEASAIQNYFFAPVAGVHQGSTGTVSSASCRGACGQPPTVPVDLVIILDRTLSMAGSSGGADKITSLKNAAKAVLSVYDPAKQHVGLALTGPGVIDSSGNPVTSGSCSPAAYGYYDNDNWTPYTTLNAAVTSTATTITVKAPHSLGFGSTPFTIDIDTEHMTVTSVSGSAAPYTWTVTRHVDGSTAASHSSGSGVYKAAAWPANTTNMGMWVPVGLSGSDASAPVTGTAGTYQVGGVPSTSSYIVKAINCISAASDGTDLATPLRMAQQYLDHYGRKGVTQGIILETDGHPQYGFAGSGDQWTTHSGYTCVDALAAATAIKHDTTKSDDGIQLFTIGYGVDSSVICPKYTTTMSNSNGTYNMFESTTWSGRKTTDLLKAMATDPSHYFENPSSSQLAAVFTQAAVQLVTGKPRLVELYPAPIVTGVSGGHNVTISGEYFSGATSVFFGGLPAVSFSVGGDASISAVAPAGPSGQTVDVTVQTPGGISLITSADHYTFP